MSASHIISISTPIRHTIVFQALGHKYIVHELKVLNLKYEEMDLIRI